LESWLVRRFVCQLTNKNYNRFFVSLLSKVKAAKKGGAIFSNFRARLNRSTQPTFNMAGDNEIWAGGPLKPSLLRARTERRAKILRSIEERIRTSRNESVTLPKQLSVEHLLPQKGTLADYPYAEKMPLQLTETPERCRGRMINTMGNLTLLTQELNSSVSNGP